MPAENGISQPAVAFPDNDVFRPLVADLKQPRFFATFQAVRVRNPAPDQNIGSSVNVGRWVSARTLGCLEDGTGVTAGRSESWQVSLPSSI